MTTFITIMPDSGILYAKPKREARGEPKVHLYEQRTERLLCHPRMRIDSFLGRVEIPVEDVCERCLVQARGRHLITEEEEE